MTGDSFVTLGRDFGGCAGCAPSESLALLVASIVSMRGECRALTNLIGNGVPRLLSPVGKTILARDLAANLKALRPNTARLSLFSNEQFTQEFKSSPRRYENSKYLYCKNKAADTPHKSI